MGLVVGPWLACAAGALGAQPRSSTGPAKATDRGAAWREDLRFLADELPKRHINPFHTITRADWDRSVAELDAAIPSIEDHQVVARLAALVTAIGDAQTQLNTHGRFGQYPVQLRAFQDDVYVTAATPEHADLIAGRLLSIDGTDVSAARAAVSPLATQENEVMQRTQTTRMLAVPEGLHTFGVAKGVDRAAFVFDRDGARVDRQLASLEPGKPVSWKFPEALTGDQAPLYFRDQRQAYWWTWLEGDSILYIAYNRCVSEEERPFNDFMEEVMGEIEKAAVQIYTATRAAHQRPPGSSPTAQRPKPLKVVIDLRNNAGGNSEIATPLILELRKIGTVNRRGRLFVLIGERTQSSAMMNALHLREVTAAILLGEPTGGRPNSYGEIKGMKLPRSGMVVWYSTQQLLRVQGKDAPSVFPDEYVAPTAAEFFAGHDPVMERVRAWKE